MIFDEQRYSCEGCPCLNNDYESGESCNLGYDCDLRWNQNEKLHSTSSDCQLISVIRKDGPTFFRSKKSEWTHVHPNNWNK